jgi:hypothetical protein
MVHSAFPHMDRAAFASILAFAESHLAAIDVCIASQELLINRIRSPGRGIEQAYRLIDELSAHRARFVYKMDALRAQLAERVVQGQRQIASSSSNSMGIARFS